MSERLAKNIDMAIFNSVSRVPGDDCKSILIWTDKYLKYKYKLEFESQL